MWDYYFCKIYVDCNCSMRELIRAICSVAQGEVQGTDTIQTTDCHIDVEDNDDFDEVMKANPDDGFLYYRFYLDVDPLPGCEGPEYIQSVGRLLQSLRARGYKLVPASDFEDQLPR